MASFEFKGMVIKQLTAHTVFARSKDKELVPPDCATDLIELAQDALDLIQVRITDALGSTSHGVEMAIQNSEQESFMQRAASMMHSPRAAFVAESQTLAHKLAEAQTSTRWPGGVVIVMSGTVGGQSKPFVAVIKAETDKGFNVTEKDGKITLELIKKMLLSETQRLYKVGILVEINSAPADLDGKYLPENYRAFLFDHLLTTTETKAAAAYFYSAFLGLSILSSSRRQTQVFFEETKNFINTVPLEEEDRYNLREALRTELRSNAPTLSGKAFAEAHLPEEHRKAYLNHLSSKGFPDQAVLKDNEYIKLKLRRPRNVVFSSGVSIRVPADQTLKELVEISAAADGFTSVKIKGVVSEQD
jgi:hypothetical protein